jgi:hypothetical protein
LGLLWQEDMTFRTTLGYATLGCSPHLSCLNPWEVPEASSQRLTQTPAEIKFLADKVEFGPWTLRTLKTMVLV